MANNESQRSMLAVLNESLRRYPPATGDLPRIVPKGGTTILGKHVAEGVRFYSDLTYHERNCSADLRNTDGCPGPPVAHQPRRPLVERPDDLRARALDEGPQVRGRPARGHAAVQLRAAQLPRQEVSLRPSTPLPPPHSANSLRCV